MIWMMDVVKERTSGEHLPENKKKQSKKDLEKGNEFWVRLKAEGLLNTGSRNDWF